MSEPDDGGRAVPDNLVADMIARMAAGEPSPWRSMFPAPPPLTRRQRMVGRLRGLSVARARRLRDAPRHLRLRLRVERWGNPPPSHP